MLENFNAFSKLAHLDFNIPLPHILLPLALSFVTFQQIAFLFDCYKRVKGELNENLHIDFIDYALFISFFPQLIAGPIVHHREMMPQFNKLGEGNSSLGMQFRTCEKFWESADSGLALSQNFSQIQKPHRKYFDFDSQSESPTNQTQNAEYNEKNKSKNILQSFCYFWLLPKVESPLPLKPNPPSKADSQNLGAESTTINYEFLAKGIFIFSIGLFKKVFIADSFAKWANVGFRVVESGEMLNIAESWATSLSYTFQLYFDFSGYCDMAIGLALMFGIVLPLNFDSPYKSLNISEFWRRWHITLGRFLKECVYIPLGGNRVSKILNLRNLFIVAFLSGIWHGAGWGFVIWGALHGMAMVIHRIYSWILANSACGNSVLGMQFRTCGNFWTSTDSSLVDSPKISTNTKAILQSLPLRFCDSQNLGENQVKIAESNTNSATRAKNTKPHFTQTRFYKILCWFITFNFVNLAWIFFRAENLNGAVNLLKGMFGFSKVEMTHHYSKFFSALNAQSNEMIIWIICAFILCLAFKNAFEMLSNFKAPYFRFCASLQIFNKTLFIKCGAIFSRFVFAMALFYISIWIMLSNLLIANTYTPFLYFNF